MNPLIRMLFSDPITPDNLKDLWLHIQELLSLMCKGRSRTQLLELRVCVLDLYSARCK